MFTSSNRIALVAATLLMIGQGSADAFHFGLGNAAAAAGAKVVNKANSDYMNLGGLIVPALPSCGSSMALFTAPPVTDPTFVGFMPVGHVFPPGHTFPADHSYFNFDATSTQLLAINLYAPGDGWVTQITTLYASGNTPDGYVLTFQPCAEVKLENLSVNILAPALVSPPGPTLTTCSSDGGNFAGAVASCVTNMEAPVKAGQLLGTGGLVDFGPIEDTRMQIQGFIDPSRHNLNRGFCPINYFIPSLQTAYDATLGGNNGATVIPRTIAPICGTIMQDLPGTVQGDWFYPGAPYPPDDPHLALIHHNVVPSTGSFSVGSSIPGFAGSHDFNPKTSVDGTRINYDFSLVTDNQIYCYDTLLIEFNNGAGGPDPAYVGYIVLLQMPDAQLDTLKIELQNPTTSCAATAGSWALTPAAVTFQR